MHGQLTETAAEAHQVIRRDALIRKYQDTMFGVCLANCLDCSRVQRPRQMDARNLGAEERANSLYYRS
ncbi:MAG: hypothetical protein CME47_02815 [Halieaceae bacterium]|nr:hypothetical protein [Halieaceae bacterium]|tara:strand:+ start:556 stop:759 length:204 start_codon:yes stop_codon:yes gene_type:complete